MSEDRELTPLTDEEKLKIMPEIAHRAALLYKLYQLDMIREPTNNLEQAVRHQVEELWSSPE
ncbi:MAG: hypothetical protein WB565_16560 [Acidimicrobiales bacterium]